MAPSSGLPAVSTHLVLTASSELPTAVASTKGSGLRNTQAAGAAEEHSMEYRLAGGKFFITGIKCIYFNSHFKSLCSLDSRFTRSLLLPPVFDNALSLLWFPKR